MPPGNPDQQAVCASRLRPIGKQTGFRRSRGTCSRIVLIAEVDEQRLAHRLISVGSSLSPSFIEGPRGANERWKPARGGKAVRTVAGFRTLAKAGGRSTPRWKAPWIDESVPFDEATEMRSWRVTRRIREALASRASWVGRDRGCQRSYRKPDRRSKTPRSGGAVRRGCRSQHSPGPNGARLLRYVVAQGLGPGRHDAVSRLRGDRSFSVAVKRRSTRAIEASASTGCAEPESRKAQRTRARDSINP